METSADHPPLWKVIAGATLLVGTLDISDAFIFYGLRGVTPARILQGIASGVLGLRPTPPLIPLINGVAALVFCIGIPLAFIARRYVPQQIA